MRTLTAEPRDRASARHSHVYGERVAGDVPHRVLFRNIACFGSYYDSELNCQSTIKSAPLVETLCETPIGPAKRVEDSVVDMPQDVACLTFMVYVDTAWQLDRASSC